MAQTLQSGSAIVSASGAPPPAVILARLLNNAAADVSAAPERIDAILHDATAALSAMRRELARKRHPSPTGLLPWQTRRLHALVEGRLHEKLTVPAMAAAARRSRGYFSRAFAASFGCPPHSYLQARRVERAKQLMCETSKPLVQIAVACGLSDQAHLCRLFRHHVGCTPSAWRRGQNGLPAVSAS